MIVPKLPLLRPANLTDLNEWILSNTEDETQNIMQVSKAVCHIPELSDESLQLFMVIPTDVYTVVLHEPSMLSSGLPHTLTYEQLIHLIQHNFPVSFYIKIYIPWRLGKLS